MRRNKTAFEFVALDFITYQPECTISEDIKP